MSHILSLSQFKRFAFLFVCMLCVLPSKAQDKPQSAQSAALPVTYENVLGTYGIKEEGTTIGVRFATDSVAKFVITVTDEETLAGTIRVAVEGKWSITGDKITFIIDPAQVTANYYGSAASEGKMIEDMLKQMILSKLAKDDPEMAIISKTITVEEVTKDYITLSGIEDEAITLQRAVERQQ